MRFLKMLATCFATVALLLSNMFVVSLVHAESVHPLDGDNSQWVSNSPNVTVVEGQTFTLNFTFANDGTNAWTDAGGYGLACDTYYHPGATSWDGISSINSCLGADGVKVGLNGNSIEPGKVYPFSVTLTAPNIDGYPSAAALHAVGFDVWFDMEHNGSIFGNNNVFVSVTVLPSDEAGIGQVWIPKEWALLYDANGNQLPARICPNGRVGPNDYYPNYPHAALPGAWDVVELAGLPATSNFSVEQYSQGDQYYILVAYPDPCQPGLDFSDNASIANGSGAVGYINVGDLSLAQSVVPSFGVSHPDWRECWDPTQCGDASFPTGSNSVTGLQLAGSAWINGTSVDPHWWKVQDPFNQGNSAAVYGRDWSAQTCLFPVPPQECSISF